MKGKIFWIPFMTALSTLCILEIIGYIFGIRMLMIISYDWTSSKEYVMTLNYSFIPLIICFLIGKIIERIMKNIQKNSLF